MRLLTVLFLFACNPAWTTYVLIGELFTAEQKTQLFDLVLRGEPPRAFYNPETLDLHSACHNIVPSLHLEWLPPTLWQLAVLHAFFHNQTIQEGILACANPGWETLSYEQTLHAHLPSATYFEEIGEWFDQLSYSLPNLPELFFQVNESIACLYKRAMSSDQDMLHLVLSEIPPFHEWEKRQFPFWQSPWIYDLNAAHHFYTALTNRAMLSKLIKIERLAHEKGEWILYRGYPGTGYPSTLEAGELYSHALSFGSTLLGGTFFSLEAAALTYAQSTSALPYKFLALRVTPDNLRNLFRIGPLHPFVQLLVDGEMFHAHTKIAASHSGEYKNKTLNGYFMRSNRHCNDPLGYIISLTMQPEDLEKAFHSLCENSGTLFEYK